MAPVQISIVIPTYNRRALLSRTLPTIFQQTCPPNAYEVIIVVDGSTDGTSAMLRQLRPSCEFLVLEQPNRGPSPARNAGLRVARGDLILFLDDDLLCDPNLVGEHLGAHQSGENQLAFGPIFVSPESPPTLAARWTRRTASPLLERFQDDEIRVPRDAHIVPNASVHRKALLALGGFDEVLFPRALEDYDLCYRLWRSGVSFRFRRTAITHQVYTKGNRELIHGDGALFGKAEVRLYRKHRDLRRYSQFGRAAEEGSTKTIIRQMAARVPIPFDLAASVPCWLADRFPRSQVLERVGLRCLSARRAVAMLLSAVPEVGGWKAFKREFGLVVPVLLFHHIGPVRPGMVLSRTISPRKFERHLRWLKRHGYAGIRASDWQAWLRGEKALPDKPVMLTFDDAYADIAEYALPLLNRFGFSATVFVVTSQIGGSSLWNQKDGSAAIPCMSVDQIRQWAARGFEFGSHSRTHSDLRTLDDADLANEIEGSARDLSKILGASARSFAYPYGYYSQAVKKQVEQAFDLAFTCDEGRNGLGTDPCLLRRTQVGSHDCWLDLAFYMSRGSSPVDRLRPWRQRFRLGSRSLAPWQSVTSSSR